MKHISLPVTMEAAKSAHAVKRMVPEAKDIARTGLGPPFHVPFFSWKALLTAASSAARWFGGQQGMGTGRR